MMKNGGQRLNRKYIQTIKSETIRWNMMFALSV